MSRSSKGKGKGQRYYPGGVDIETARAAMDRGVLWSLAQLSWEAHRWLAGEIKAGRVIAVRGWWPWVTHGTVEKTYYRWNNSRV